MYIYIHIYHVIWYPIFLYVNNRYIEKPDQAIPTLLLHSCSWRVNLKFNTALSTTAQKLNAAPWLGGFNILHDSMNMTKEFTSVFTIPTAHSGSIWINQPDLVPSYAQASCIFPANRKDPCEKCHDLRSGTTYSPPQSPCCNLGSRRLKKSSYEPFNIDGRMLDDRMPGGLCIYTINLSYQYKTFILYMQKQNIVDVYMHIYIHTCMSYIYIHYKFSEKLEL